MARGPSSFNWVTFLLLAAAGALTYGTWKFFPVYWNGLQVDHVLSDGAGRAYAISKVKGYEQARIKEKLIAELRTEVVALGIRDPEMTLGMEFTPDRVYLTCDYREVVVHLFVERFTVMPMHRKASGSLGPAQYGR